MFGILDLSSRGIGLLLRKFELTFGLIQLLLRLFGQLTSRFVEFLLRLLGELSLGLSAV